MDVGLIGDALGEVEAVKVSAGGWPPGCLNEVGDAGAGVDCVDAGAGDGAADVGPGDGGWGGVGRMTSTPGGALPRARRKASPAPTKARAATTAIGMTVLRQALGIASTHLLRGTIGRPPTAVKHR